MTKERLLLWHGANKNSFWEERKFLYENTPDRRETHVSAPDMETLLKQFTHEATRPLNILGNCEENEPKSFPSMDDWFMEQTQSLQSWYTRINVLSHDSAYEETFQRFHSPVANETTQQKEERKEIEKIMTEMGVTYKGTSGFNKMVKGIQDQAQGNLKARFRDELRKKYEEEHRYFTQNIELVLDGQINTVNRDINTLLKNKDFASLQSSPEFNEQIGGGVKDLQRMRLEIQQLASIYNLSTLENDLSAGARGTMQQEFQQELANYAERNGKTPDKISALEKQEIWKNTLEKRMGEEFGEFRQKIADFNRTSARLRLQVKELEEFLEENATKPAEDIVKKIPKEILDSYYPADAGKTFGDYVKEQLEAETDPVKRALRASQLLANADKIAEDLKNNDAWQKGTPAEKEAIIAKQEQEREKIKILSDEFDGNWKEVAKKIKDADDLLDTINKNYVTDITDSDGKKIPNETLDPTSKSHIQKTVNDYKKKSRKYKKLVQLLAERKDDEATQDLRALNEEVITMQSEVNDLQQTIFDALKNKADGESSKGVEIKWVSPLSIWESIKNIVEIFHHESEHDDKINAALLEQNLGAALKGLPGFVGDRFATAEKKGGIKKESLDAEERGEFKYENHDHNGVIQIFHEWNDNNEQHLRVLIEEMVKRGIMRWDDHKLWEHMEGLTGISMPKAAEDDAGLRDVILEKMFIAGFGDKNWFRDQKNASMKGFISKYQEQDAESKKIEGMGQSSEKMAYILRAHYNAAKDDLNEFGQMPADKAKSHQFDIPDVDPHLYTSILLSCINAQGIRVQDKVFFLVRGIASGLVPHEILSHVEDRNFFNEWATLNIFRKASFKQILEMDKKMTCQGRGKSFNFKAEKNDDLRQEYLFKGHKPFIDAVLCNELSTNGGVLDRTERMIENWNKVDKDVHQDALHKVSTSDMHKLFEGYSGRVAMSSAGIKNGIMGWSTRLASHDGTNAQILGNSLASFIIFEGGVRKRTLPGGKLEIKDAEWDQSPGECFCGIQSGEYAQITKNFLTTFLSSIDESEFTDCHGFKKSEIPNVLFNDNYARNSDGTIDSKKQKQQTDFILQFGGKVLPRIIKDPKNQEKLTFLTEIWQKEHAFATAYDAGEARAKGATGSSVTGLNEALQWSKEGFEQWKQQKGQINFTINGKEYKRPELLPDE